MVEGLSVLGMHEAIVKYADLFGELFIHKPATLTWDIVDQLYKVNQWSEPGSNKLKAEKRVVAWWKDMLLDFEGMFPTTS